MISIAGHSEVEIAATAQECAGIFVLRAHLPDGLLVQLPSLRVIARIGTGYDRIDVESARRRGICVTYVPEHCTEEMSDHAMLGILAFSKKLPVLMAEKRWLALTEVPWPTRLSAQTLGIIGFGRSGRRTAEKARAFGMKTLVWNRTPRQSEVEFVGASCAPFDDVLGCDYVSLHIPGVAETENLIDKAALCRMKPTGVLINTARGSIVDTDALVDALSSGTIGGALLDVVSPEPLPSDHPLWNLPNVIVTSHTASLSLEAIYHATATAFRDMIAVLTGRRPIHPVPELAVHWA